MPELIIFIRTQVDWSKMTPELFMQQSDRKDAALSDHIKKLQEANLPKLWSETFGIDYFSFRLTMSQIAMKQNKLVKNARIVVGLENLRELLEDNKEYYICPTDDDDWFHPDLYLTSRQFEDPNVGFAQWNTVKYFLPSKFYIVKNDGKNFDQSSNQLMFSKKFIKQNLQLKKINNLLSRHWQAKFLNKENLKKIDLNLSIKNNHIAHVVNVLNALNNFEKLHKQLDGIISVKNEEKNWWYQGIKETQEAHKKLKESKKPRIKFL
jgi:hypothetical protein